MAACEACGATDRFLFRCDRCGRQFCDAHLSTGAHACDVAPVPTPAPDKAGEPTASETPGASDDTPVSQRVQAALPSLADLEAKLPPTRTVLGLATLFLVLAAALGGYALFGPFLQDVLPPALGGAGGGPASGSTDGTVRPVNETAVERGLADGVNAFRRDQGVGTVEYDPALVEIARYHSRDMADQNYTGHVSPEGETVQDRFDRFDYQCASASELVLFTHYGTEISTLDGTMRFDNESELANGILELWLQSTSHQEALLTPSWERLGAGVNVTDSDGVFVTLNAC